MAVWFFTYGDDNFKDSKNRIKKEAEESHFFDKIFVFGPQHLDKEFIEKTKPYILSVKGGGFWLWQSYFLKHIFSQMNDGDYCFYVDAGCTINSSGKKRFFEYLKMLDSTETGCVAFCMKDLKEYPWTNNLIVSVDNLYEYQWTNGATLEYFNSDDSIKNSFQLVAGISMFKKNELSCNLIDEYYKIAISRPDLFSDDHNNGYNVPGFKDHRHNQSVFSILRKKYNVLQVKDEVGGAISLSQEDLESKLIPIIATRLRDSCKKRSWLTRLFS